MAAEVWEFDGVSLRDPGGETVPWPRLAVLGDPIAHSISPVLHGAALRARGIAGEYRAIRVRPEHLRSAVEQLRSTDLRGLNLTIPHKAPVLELGLDHSEECAEIGAANTLVRRGGRWCLHNTDARGFAMALERALGVAMGSRLDRVVLIGAGGAARAVASALRALGARRVEILVRDVGRAEWAPHFRATVRPLLPESVGHATLLVQCTPLGLDADDPSPVSLGALSAGAFVVDLTYAPGPSRFLREASARGCEVMDGRSMLVAQAALAFSMWFGAEPPFVEMAEAIELSW